MTEEKQLTRRERNLADIRDRATIIAEQIVFSQGVDGLSARGLAKELNVSVGSLYNAFGDMNAVVHAVIAKTTVMLSNSLYNSVKAAAPNRRARLVALGEAYLNFALAEPRRWWLMFEYNSDLPFNPKAQEFQNGLLDMLIEAGEADTSSDQHRQFFLLLWASVHGLVSLACRPTIVAINPDAARNFIADLVDMRLNSSPKNSPHHP